MASIVVMLSAESSSQDDVQAIGRVITILRHYRAEVLKRMLERLDEQLTAMLLAISIWPP